MAAITWATIKAALDAANPEQLERAASVWLWDGIDGGNGWIHDTGMAIPGVEIGRADDIHEVSHGYVTDAIMLVVGPVPVPVLKAFATASTKDGVATASATATGPTLCPACAARLKGMRD